MRRQRKIVFWILIRKSCEVSLFSGSLVCFLLPLFFGFCSWHCFSLQALQKFQFGFFVCGGGWGGCLFVSFGSRVCPNSTCTQLFLVSRSFFFCCWSRDVYRCRHCRKGSQVCLTLRYGLWVRTAGDNRKERNQEGRFLQILAHHYLHTMRRKKEQRVCTWSEGRVHFCRWCQKYCSNPLSLYESRPFLHQSGGQGWGVRALDLPGTGLRVSKQAARSVPKWLCI